MWPQFLSKINSVSTIEFLNTVEKPRCVILETPHMGMHEIDI